MAQGRKVMIDMLLEYDESVDAAYLTKFLNCLTGPEIPGSLTCAD